VPTVWLVKVRLEGESEAAGVGVGAGELFPLPQPEITAWAAISASVAENFAMDE